LITGNGAEVQRSGWRSVRRGATATAILDQPPTRNALSLALIEELTAALKDWAHDAAISGVILRGADNRVFSSGGDLAALYAAHEKGDRGFAEHYFRSEFRLDHLIATYPKPLMAVLNGLTMGGGAGISIHAAIRVATNATLFAMPETGIGYFPDCGAAHFLNRCPGMSGRYLALTGQRIQAADLCHLGLATHYVPVPDLDRLDFANLEAQARGLVPAPLAAKSDSINAAFGATTIEEILERLSGAASSWGASTIAALQRQNPLSLKVALAQLQHLAGADLAEIFRMQYRICQHFMTEPCFYEGIRAAIIDADRRPRWPRALAEVAQAEIDRFFAPVAGIADWTPEPLM
jgi:enoyl-CoA hydratase